MQHGLHEPDLVRSVVDVRGCVELSLEEQQELEEGFEVAHRGFRVWLGGLLTVKRRIVRKVDSAMDNGGGVWDQVAKRTMVDDLS